MNLGCMSVVNSNLTAGYMRSTPTHPMTNALIDADMICQPYEGVEVFCQKAPAGNCFHAMAGRNMYKKLVNDNNFLFSGKMFANQ